MSYWGIPVSIGSQITNPVDTDVSTLQTIHQMREVVNISSHSPRVSAIVDSLIRSLPKQYSTRDIARAFFWWIKNHVKFREDESILSQEMGYVDPIQELLIAPEVLVSMPQPEGDCDDFSMLMCTMLAIAGMHSWLVVIAVDPQQPLRWSHVYVKSYLPEEDQFIILDCSHGSFPGWETRREIYRRMEWPIS